MGFAELAPLPPRSACRPGAGGNRPATARRSRFPRIAPRRSTAVVAGKMEAMSVLAAGPAAGTRAPRRFAAYAWCVLAFNILVVLWGAYVRASGSGAGCGSHWPLCNGEVVPRSPALATIIEFTHRVTSGLALALVAGLVAWAFRAFPRRHPARLGAVLSLAFILSEALIGAGLVLFEHVAKNASTARAWSLSAHLVNTLTLLACLALTAWWASGGAGNSSTWMPCAAFRGQTPSIPGSGTVWMPIRNSPRRGWWGTGPTTQCRGACSE